MLIILTQRYPVAATGIPHQCLRKCLFLFALPTQRADRDELDVVSPANKNKTRRINRLGWKWEYNLFCGVEFVR